MFKLNFGLKEDFNNYKIIERNAVKGIIIKDNKLLMILTNKGDYKFIGGGIKENETLENALNREILEESGFKVEKIEEVLGKTIEKNFDKYEENTIFVMYSTYIKCSLDFTNKQDLNLDDYEKQQDFKVVFIDIKDAIENNENLIKNNKDLNSWIYRETEVLKQLINILN